MKSSVASGLGERLWQLPLENFCEWLSYERNHMPNINTFPQNKEKYSDTLILWVSS